MNELFERLGATKFLQVALEGWNEVFLLILIAVMMIGIRHDKTDELVKRVKIPLTNELILFFAAIFIYNLSNMISLCVTGVTTTTARCFNQICVFGYYAAGGFQTLLFLQVIRNYVVEMQESPRLHRTVFVFQLLQIPLFLLLLVTPFTHALYYLDAHNVYQRSWGYWVWQAVTVLTFVFAGIVMIVKWHCISGFLKRIITVATVLPLIAMVASIYVDEVNINNILIAVTALIMFLSYERNKNEITLKNAYALEKAKTELAESRLTMMLAQIKPHFIYNSMNAIMELCYTEPELAAETIAHFSDYLRGKLEAFDSKELAWFDDELGLIKEYLSIEYADRNKVFRVEYDLACKDFRLPALTVQPLVENAVKHGVDRYSADSLVQIITREDEQSICIEVTDNATAEQGEDSLFAEERGVGIRNVSERLRMMCGGTLEVKHTEAGTTATVRIPRNKTED